MEEKVLLRSWIVILTFTCINSLWAEDWNQWRGADRTGVFRAFKPPEIWPKMLTQKWKIDVGVGHSSPLLYGKRIFLFSRVDEDEVIASFDLETGKQIWKDQYPASYNMNQAAIPHGKGPKSTPVIGEGRLFTFGIGGILSSYDISSGKLLWRNDFKKEFPVTAPDFGTAMSPSLEKGLLFVHAGGPGKGAFLALEAGTGEEKWRWDGDGPAYASPILVTLNGTRQIVTQTQLHIVGLSVADGKLLWKMPFTTEYEQNSVTPVAYKDLLIFSGLNKGIFAVRLSQKEGGWLPETVWQNERAGLYLSSPVVVGDFVYGMTHFRKGQFFCLDARTGVTRWTSNGAEGDHASIAAAGNFLFILTEDGQLSIVKASPDSFERVQEYTLAQSPTWAHPALAENKIAVKELKSLSLWTIP